MTWPPTTHADVDGEITMLRGGQHSQRTGTYYFASSAAASAGVSTLGNGSLRVSPMIVTRTMTIDRLGSEVATVGDVGSKVRLGIYSDDGTGRPGNLLIDAGQIAGDSATVQELTISQQLTPGIYWFGGVVQSVTTTQPSVRCAANWFAPIPVGISTALPGAAASAIGHSHASVTAALPTTFTTTPGATVSVPRLFYRVL